MSVSFEDHMEDFWKELDKRKISLDSMSEEEKKNYFEGLLLYLDNRIKNPTFDINETTFLYIHSEGLEKLKLYLKEKRCQYHLKKK